MKVCNNKKIFRYFRFSAFSAEKYEWIPYFPYFLQNQISKVRNMANTLKYK